MIKKSNCIEEGIEEYTAKCKFQGNFYNDNRAKMIARLTPDVSLEETKLTVHVTEGKEIDLNSNYPNDYIKSLKAAKNGIVRVKGNEIYGENQESGHYSNNKEQYEIKLCSDGRKSRCFII